MFQFLRKINKLITRHLRCGRSGPLNYKDLEDLHSLACLNFFCRFKYVCCTFYLPQIAKDDVIRQSGQRFEWSVDEAKHWSFIVQIMRKRTTNHPSTSKILYYSPKQYQSSKQRMGVCEDLKFVPAPIPPHHSLIKGQLWIPLRFLILRISWVAEQLPSEAFPP